MANKQARRTQCAVPLAAEVQEGNTRHGGDGGRKLCRAAQCAHVCLPELMQDTPRCLTMKLQQRRPFSDHGPVCTAEWKDKTFVRHGMYTLTSASRMHGDAAVHPCSPYASEGDPLPMYLLQGPGCEPID